MAKYADVARDVEGLFGTAEWITHGITAYPSNYQGGDYENEFVKLEILPNRALIRYSDPSVEGSVIVQIYTKAGLGITRAMEIADLLDNLMQTQSLTRGTTLGTSSLSFLGIDSQDNSLHRADYFIPFRLNRKQ